MGPGTLNLLQGSFFKRYDFANVFNDIGLFAFYALGPNPPFA